MSKLLFHLSLLAINLMVSELNAQVSLYSTANAHAHNDYLNKIPFYSAYNADFGSIEVDVFPIDGELFVAHDKHKISKDRTLKGMYLRPLQEELLKEKKRQIRLLIDIKENYKAALPLLIQQLEPIKQLLTTPEQKGQLTIVISGYRPVPREYVNYPEFILFDDNLQIPHTPEQLKRVALVSRSFKQFSAWKGDNVFPEKDLEKVVTFVDRVHKAGKPVRFWAAPDNKTAWLEQIEMGVDVIGTDKVEELKFFLQQFNKRR